MISDGLDGCVGEGCLIDVWVELGSGAGLSVMLIVSWIGGSPGV